MPPVPIGGRRQNLQQPAGRISFQYGGQTRFAQFGTPQQRLQYGWGDPGALSGAQDITRQFATQFQPNAGIFSPNFPLVPVEPELTRLWDYPTGWNLVYTPRSYEPITFEELRALANSHDITRLAIETRKDQIEKLDWQIKPIDEKNAPRGIETWIKTMTRFWRRPDGGDRSFAGWLREILEDLLVIDAPTLEILRNRDGTVRGYDIVDGSTIKPLIDITGRPPTGPAPSYEQVIHGRPWRLFNDEELIYCPRNKRPGHRYGYPPVEQILMTINTSLRRQSMQLMYFSEGNLPPGFLTVPELNTDQIARLQQYMNDILAGNLAERQRFQMLPYGANWTAIKNPPLKDDFDEWLARVVMFAFSLPPDAFVRMRSRATSQTAKESALEEGLAPLMGWVKRLIDNEIQIRMGQPDLEFAWQDIKQVDPEIQSKIETSYVKLGLKTVDEARDVLGLDPLPKGIGAKPFVVAGNQVLLIQDVEDASAKAIAPAPPPFSPGAGSPFGAPGGPAAGGGQMNGRGGVNGPGGDRPGTQRGDPAANSNRRVGSGGVRNGGRASERAVNNREATAGARKISGNDALDREARQLLRRARAQRVEHEILGQRRSIPAIPTTRTGL